jgi:hypothetical protein
MDHKEALGDWLLHYLAGQPSSAIKTGIQISLLELVWRKINKFGFIVC